MAAVGPALSNHPALRRLDLSGNKLGARAAAVAADLIKHCATLEVRRCKLDPGA